MYDTPSLDERAPDPERRPAVLDEDGLLRHGGRWVAVPDAQLPVVELLVRRQGALVWNEELGDAHREGGGVVTETTLRQLVRRLRKRVSNVGLGLYVVRGRGVLLEAVRGDDVT